MCLHDRYFDAFGGPVNWIETVTAECRDKLAPLFQLTARERAFLDAVLDQGEIDASSLDVPESVRVAIEACPALRWKVQNIRAWKAGRLDGRVLTVRKDILRWEISALPCIRTIEWE